MRYTPGVSVDVLYCPSCGAVSNGSAHCPYCGAALQSTVRVPAIDYRPPKNFREQGALDWVVVGSFKPVADWHRAANILSRVAIMTRMGEDPADSSASALAVPAPDAQIARQLLARAMPREAIPAEPQLRAFPVVMPPSLPTAAYPSEPPEPMPSAQLAMTVLPVNAPPPGGSAGAYATIMTALWIILAAIIIACAVAILG
jgi:hypothetical protein